MGIQSTRKSLRKAMRALLRKRNFNSITIDDICDVTEISRRTFYRYYPDKFALLNDVYDKDFFDKIPKRDDWNVWDYHEQICFQVYEDAGFFRHAFDVKGQNGFWEGCKNLLIPLIKKDVLAYNDKDLEESTIDAFIERDTDWLFTVMRSWISHDPAEDPGIFSQKCRTQYAKYMKMAYQIASTVKGKTSSKITNISLQI